MKKIITKRLIDVSLSQFNLTMKLTTLLFLISVINIQASSYSQNTKITLKLNSVNVMDVLESIEKLTEFKFLGNENIIDKSRLVSIDVKDKRVNKILDDLFNQTEIDYNLIGKQVVLFENKFEVIEVTKDVKPIIVQKIVTGMVMDSSGEPLPGASIIEKGTKKGQQTDFDGKFSMRVSNENAILIVSYIGFKSKEVSVKGKSNLSIVLEENANSLEEVVLVGYGSQKKSDLTGAVVRADVETFKNQPNTDIAEILQGSVSGLNVGISTTAGESSGFQVRGITNLSDSGNGPLLVVDGIIYRGKLSDINPSDVASIDVLKDASSTAIYGSQAANGVIVISTKTGKRGESKPVFNYSTKYSVRKDANRLTYHDNDGYLQLITDFDWRNSYSEGPNYDPNYSPLNGLNPPEFDGHEAGANVNWQDLIARTGYLKQHDFSVTGATDKLNYFVSAGITSQDDVLRGDNYERISARINLEFKFTDWLKFGTNTFTSIADYSGIEYNRGGYRLSPFSRPFNEDGSLVRHPNGQLGDNPLINRENLDDDQRLQLNSVVYAMVNIPGVEGLSYRVNYGNSYRTVKNNTFSFNANEFKGRGIKAHNISHDWTLDNILNYNRTFGKHAIDITGVYGLEEEYDEGTKSTGNNYANSVLGYHQLEAAEIQLITSSAGEASSVYQLLRFLYTFDDKYNLKLTSRRDGYSGFAANKKSATFSTLGLGWTISKESFFEPLINVVNRLKLRGSYGEAGNRGSVSPYSTLAAVSSGDDYVFGDGGITSKGYQFSRLASPDLEWENTVGIDLGLEFGLYNNRITADIGWYDTTSQNQIYNVTIPAINGFNNQKVNLGELENKGIEISLNSRNIQTKKFQWRTGIVFSKNKTKIVSLRGIDADGDGIEDDDIASQLFIGEDPFSVYNYNITGLYQIGDVLPNGSYEPGYYIVEDINGDGTTDSNDRTIIGSTSPDFRISMTNTFKYKNFTFSFFINSIQGGKNGYLGRDSAFRTYDDREKGKVQANRPVDVDYWTPNNPNSEYPSLRYKAPESGLEYYKDRSFIRLQDVSLSYTLEKSLIEKLGLKDFTVIFGGKNLATWTKWKGVDPETGSGLTNGRPVIKSYTLGLNVSF